MTQPVETTSKPATATEAPASAPVETAGQNVPATPVKTYTEDDVKAAREQARREAQADKDKEIARLHREQQQRERQLTESSQRRSQAYAQAVQSKTDPALAMQAVDVWEKAQQYDAWQAQQQQQQAWSDYVSQSAQAAGLDPTDMRLAGATSAIDLASKIAAAARADERAAREKERQKAEEAERKALDDRVNSGNLDTLTGAPAGGANLEEQYKKEVLANRGKGSAVLRDIKDKYRKKGLNVDTIRL